MLRIPQGMFRGSRPAPLDKKPSVGHYAPHRINDPGEPMLGAVVRFLLKQKVKIVVIACNTATAYGLDAARELVEREGGGVRLIGVVDAGARDAVAVGLATADGRPWSIGVLATNGTVLSGVYERSIRAELVRCGVTDDVRIFSRGCPGLADAVEGDDQWAHEIAGGYLRALLGEQKAKAPNAPMRAIVLGCTHFPYVRGELERMVPDVRFVDPAASASIACHKALAEDGLLAGGVDPAQVDAYVSVPSKSTPAACLDGRGWFSRAYKYNRCDANDGSTTIMSVGEALESGILPFPRYLNALPAFSGYIKNFRKTNRRQK